MRCPITSTGSSARPARRRAAAWLLALSSVALAALAAAAGPNLLPAEQAFRLSARVLDPSTLEVRYNVADGYYLYRDKLRMSVEPPPAASGTPLLPPGLAIEDAFFGKVQTYRGLVVVRVPLSGARPGTGLTLVADSQGCADVGVCYPPQSQRLALKVPAAGASPEPPVEAVPARKLFFN